MSDRVYRFGIVGTGMIAEFHAKAIEAMPRGELVAVQARSLAKAEAFTETFGGQAYESLDDFLAHENLDIVTICTPSGAHLDPALAAAKAGKHIICEKPLEVTIERIDEMLAACDQAGVTLSSVLPRRFNDSTQLLKKAVDQGRFGQIVMADAYIKWWRTQEYYDSAGWRGTWALDGGGALMNQSIHTIDLLLHVMGPVKRVSAFAGLEAHKDIEVEDVAVAILEFESGARGVIQGSTACYAKQGHPAQVQICGTKGSVFMVDDRFDVWEFQDDAPEDDQIMKVYGTEADVAGAGAADPKAISFQWHQRNFEDMIQALDQGVPPKVDGRQGRGAVELIGAIYQSAAQGGQVVELPLTSMPAMKPFG